jgi:outer membrane protein insertion porin family
MSRRWLAPLLAIVAWTVPAAAAEPQPRPATLQVSGYGFFGNRDLRRALLVLQTGEEPPAAWDANFIEDAAVVLFARLNRDGYLAPRVEAVMRLADGSALTQAWEQRFDALLPRPLEARHVRFIVRPGVRYYYESVQITGLRAIKPETARRYFAETDTLIKIKSARIYTPARLEQSLADLREALLRDGYEQARVTAPRVQRDERSGAVRVEVEVEEGPRSRVRRVRVEVYGPGASEPHAVRQERGRAPFSRWWVQDLTQTLLREQYAQGFPDATAQVRVERREAVGHLVQVDVVAQVQTGRTIRVGDVRFEGAERTRPGLMQRRLRLEPGDPLDRIEAERGRYRLARLGIFDMVDMHYEEVDETSRDVVYELKEGRTMDVSVLFGYGSYELLRGGVEINRFNIFGLAHSARLRGIQSFRSSSGDFTYTMPELIGEDVNVFLRGSGLRREELTFDREEYGGGIGAQRHLRAIDTDAVLRYNYEFLNALRTGVDLEEGVQTARVASAALDLRHDRRDNPLLPRAGYHLISSLELASTVLGGDSEFQRLEFSGSFHQRLGGGRFLHLGISHGVALTLGGSAGDLPFNKRFFPGGENSIRGFRQGQAAPRNAEGRIIGAETYLLGNLELEQQLTPSWSVVGFVDAIGFAADVNEYPAQETLVSVGGGLRFRTIIGPARLEYGRNLNPRRRDPSGTIHVSIGFPF